MNIKALIKGHPQISEGTAYTILFTMGTCHLLNDMIQSVIPALYPLLKDSFGFTFAQIGIITLVFQLTSSIFQPFVGLYADRHPQPYSLSLGMCFTLIGLLSLAFAFNFLLILLAVALIGCGSSVFHPEASRVAQMASGGRKSLAQSIFQVGGNGGSAIGPLFSLTPIGTCGLLVQFNAQRHQNPPPQKNLRALQSARQNNTDGIRHTGIDDFFKIFLQCLHDQLFYLLLD